MRKLRNLGLMLIAVAALGALAAAPASAESFSFYSELQHTVLAGTAEGTQQFTVEAGSATCTGADFTGTLKKSETTEVGLTPTYTGCTADPTGTSDIVMNGCQYLLTPETKTGGIYKAKIGISCPAEKIMKILTTVFGATVCTVDVPAQVFGGLTVSEVGEGDLKVVAEATGIKYSQTGSGGCTTAEGKANGTFKGAWVISGSLAEEGVNLAMQPPPQTITMPATTNFAKVNTKAKVKITNVSAGAIANGLKYKEAATGGPFVKGISDGCAKGIAKGGSCEVELECIKVIPAGTEIFFIARTQGGDPKGVAATQIETCPA